MLREAIQYYSGCIVHRVCALESSSLQVVREAYSYVHKVLDTKSNITVLIGMIWLWIQEGGGHCWCPLLPPPMYNDAAAIPVPVPCQLLSLSNFFSIVDLHFNIKFVI